MGAESGETTRVHYNLVVDRFDPCTGRSVVAAGEIVVDSLF
jgi:hypothetical protein